MSGKVLGNDPFKRGAATPSSTPATEPATEPVKAADQDVDRIAEKARQLRAAKPLIEKRAEKPTETPLIERLAEKVAAEAPKPPAPPPPPKPVLKPMPPKPVETKRVPPKPPPPPVVPKTVMPKPKIAEGSPAKRAVTSFASSPSSAMPPPKVTAPERPSIKRNALIPDADPTPPEARPAGATTAAPERPPLPTPPEARPAGATTAAPERAPLPTPPEARPAGATTAAPERPPLPTPPEARPAGATAGVTEPQRPASTTAPARTYSPSAAEHPPEAHAHSPGMGPDPVAHAASPDLKHTPRAHADSPTIGFDPVPHSASPEARHAPEFHEGSPELRAEFTPHGTSPEMVAELVEGGATPHQGSPAVVRELEQHEPFPHRGSPEMVSDKVTDVGVAIDAAREVTEGISRPFLEAASGLMNAAKSALGFGATGAVDTWGKDEALTRSLHPIGDFLYDKYFRVTVEGADLIPTGPSIIVANHSGALPLDGPMLHYALQRERSDLQSARWLVEDQVFHAPVLGVLINRLGAVRAHPENAVRLLEEGRPVIVFPEGFLGISKPFTQRYQLKRFGRGGYIKLALKQDVPIVPVAIVGAEESMPLLAKIPAGVLGLPYLPLTPPPLPARWKIRFGEPFEVDGSPDDLAYVQEQNDRVRDTIAGMLASMLGS